MWDPSRRVRFHSRSSASSKARWGDRPVRESVSSSTDSCSSNVLRSVMSRMTTIVSDASLVLLSCTTRCLISTHAKVPSFFRMRTGSTGSSGSEMRWSKNKEASLGRIKSTGLMPFISSGFQPRTRKDDGDTYRNTMSMPVRQITSILFQARNWKPPSSSADIGAAIRPVTRERALNRFRGETCYSLSQLGIDFVSDHHDPSQQNAVVDRGQILLQSVKDAGLQNARLLDQHGGGVALPIAVRAVLCSVAGYQISGACWLGRAEAHNQLTDEERQMMAALL